MRLTAWNMDCRLRWIMFLQAPDCIRDVVTSFLFLVMLVSSFSVILFLYWFQFYWVRLFGRLLMVPVVAGISFEIIQWAGRSDSKLADFFSKPGLAMQKLTTKEPTADMAEVAIRAVEAVFDWKAYLKEEFGVEAEQ
mgnify:CR=1 FL=1